MVGDNGVLGQAINAATVTDISGIKEKIELSVTGAKADGEGELTTANLRKELNNYFDDYSLTGTATKGWTVTVDGYIYEIDPSGSVKYAGEKVEVAITPVYVKLYSQSDGSYALVFSSSDSEYVADGFTYVESYGDIGSIEFRDNWNDETETYSGNCPPWLGETWNDNGVWNNDTITTVIIADNIVPQYTSCWFSSLNSLTNIENIENINTSNVISMYGMFYNCYVLDDLDVSGFDTSNVTDMGWMFQNCYDLTSLDLSSFDTKKVTDMSGMFYYCDSLEFLDLSGFNTSEVNDMSYMFYICCDLVSLDVSSFDTSNVTDMSYMFANHWGCLTNLDLSNFNTSNVDNMEGMFYDCNTLVNLNLSNFNTSNVTNMYRMFSRCFALKTLDLSSFDTSRVTNMEYMFNGCNVLERIYASELWSLDNLSNGDNMFSSCSELVGFISYDPSKTDSTYANYTTGYFTYKAANS